MSSSLVSIALLGALGLGGYYVIKRANDAAAQSSASSQPDFQVPERTTITVPPTTHLTPADTQIIQQQIANVPPPPAGHMQSITVLDPTTVRNMQFEALKLANPAAYYAIQNAVRLGAINYAREHNIPLQYGIRG